MTQGAIGVFGGTFNPIHVGHLCAANEVLERLSLSRILFVPSGTPLHKREIETTEPIAPAVSRLEWVRLAVGHHPYFDVDPIELERSGPSYSVDTLTTLADRFFPNRPLFLIGHDAFSRIDTWHQAHRLFELADFAVIARLPTRNGTLQDWLPRIFLSDFSVSQDGQHAFHRHSGTTLRIVRIQGLEVSATDLRRRLREGQTTEDLIPEAVRQAILENGFYEPGEELR